MSDGIDKTMRIGPKTQFPIYEIQATKYIELRGPLTDYGCTSNVRPLEQYKDILRQQMEKWAKKDQKHAQEEETKTLKREGGTIETDI